MKNLFIALLFLPFLSNSLQGQMLVNQDTLYGNEWIDFDKDYYKFQLNTDGIFKISYASLISAGVPVSEFQGKDLQIYNFGKQVPIRISTEGAFGEGDFIEFYGEKNKSELDQFLFSNPETELLNPEFSMYTGFNTFFLTWDTQEENARFTEVENNLNDLPEKEAYYMEVKKEVNFATHVKNFGLQAGVFFSNYTGPEGFSQNMRASLNENLRINKVYLNDDVPAKMKVRLAFDNSQSFNARLTVSDSVLSDEMYPTNEVRTIEVEVPNSLLGNTTRTNIFSDGAKHSVSLVELTYPRQVDGNNQGSMLINLDPSAERRYFEIARFDGAVGNNYAIDLVNNEIIPVVFEGGLAKLSIEPSETNRSLFIYNDILAPSEISEITLREFRDYSSEVGKDYIIFSNPALYVDSLNGNQNWVEAYAEYRASEAGGSYKVATIDVLEMVDQFAYGIDQHPVSFRNFNYFLISKGLKAKVGLLIGKGRDYSDIRSGVGTTFPNLVPTWGFNGADNLLFATNETNAPTMAIGRIPAVEAFEIKNYLDKVKEYETEPDYTNTDERLWKKRFIHLNGGANESEIATIRSYMDLMAFNISNNQFSGQVESFYKTREDAVGESEAEKLSRLINEGVGFITFFGHSAATSFDYSINNPEGFGNEGRYFIMNAMGCNSGQIHSRVRSLSERFILTPNRGAIAFMASSGLGYISAYRTFGLDHYDRIGEDNYGGTIGEVLQENLKVLDRSFSTHKLLAQQMTLNGDPAIKMNYLTGPDYVVDEGSVEITSGALNAGMQDFDIKFDMLNLGGGVLDSIYVRIEQELPDGSKVMVSETKERTPKFYEPLAPTISGQGLASAGWNRIHITLDVFDNVEEVPNPLGESNNVYVHTDGEEGFPVYINPHGIKLEYPANYGIIGNNTVELKAIASPSVTNTDLFYVELDTTELFNSPFKVSQTINPNGTDLSWEPSTQLEEDQVYYWRMSPDTAGHNGFVWENSSFIFKDGIEDGWNQSHYFQFLKDEYRNEFLGEDRKFEFVDNYVDFKLLNKSAGGSSLPTIFLNNSYLDVYRSFTINEGFMVIVIDPKTGEPWSNPAGGLYDSETSDNARIFYFPYSSNVVEKREALVNLLENVIPDNYYVGIMSVDKTGGTLGAETWAMDSVSLGKNIFSVLEAEGATRIRDLERGDKTYIYVYQKGVGPIDEIIGETETSLIEIESSIVNVWDKGKIKSTVIGPSDNWNKLEWSSLNQESDSAYVNIYAVNPNGTETLIKANIADNNFNMDSIDASIYPFLRLELNSFDSPNRTAPQLDFWRVFYQPVSFVNTNDEIEDLGSLNIYPNPFTNQVTLDLNLLKTKQLSIEVYNSIGVRVKTLPSTTYSKGLNQLQLNTLNFAPGTYFIRVSSNDGIETQKLIKI